MANSTPGSKQSAHTDLASLLDLKTLDPDLFRSSEVRLPRGERGVFGGQVIAQAIVAANNTVDSGLCLHSLQCYFILSGLPTPIHYNVDRIRNGRSYCTRAVRAVQDGKTIFVMLCSYQKPEPWQPSFKSPMPRVPSPEECETIQAFFRKRAEEQTNAWTKRYDTGRAKYHERSPIQIRNAGDGIEDGHYILRLWMRAISLPECDAPYQKAVLGYISDLLFVGAGVNALGLRESNEEAADVLAFSTTISHAIWYYSNNIDCSQWLLIESRVPQAGSGRVIMHRRAFTRDGTLVAHFSQEAAVRAKVHGPGEPSKGESKL